ncbi:MAG: hypothetical protein LUE26_04205 [Alistipes sp.]|nr:hypothetical protein [Alistipes sp.]
MRFLRHVGKYAVAGLMLTAVFAPGCESVDTDLICKVEARLRLPEKVEGDSVIPYSPWVDVYYHYADTATWQVDSWEDARQGIATSRSGEKRQPDGMGTYDREENVIVLGPFTSGPVMLIAYDSEQHTEKYESEMYAWREVEIQAGITQLKMRLVFNPEKRSYALPRYGAGSWEKERWYYIEDRWYVANDNPYGIQDGDDDEEEDDGGDDEGGGDGDDTGGDDGDGTDEGSGTGR